MVFIMNKVKFDLKIGYKGLNFEHNMYPTFWKVSNTEKRADRVLNGKKIKAYHETLSPWILSTDKNHKNQQF